MFTGLNPDVQAYLNEHLFRTFSHKNTSYVRQTSLRPRQLRRRMSCKGAIKKTRSINADSEFNKLSSFIKSQPKKKKKRKKQKKKLTQVKHLVWKDM